MIFHIANNFPSSAVHRNLIASLADVVEERQEVFVPVRDKGLVGKNDVSGLKNVNVHYSFCLSKYMKYLPMLKVLWVLVCCAFSPGFKQLNKCSTIVAHTLWSDGMVAFFVSLIKGSGYVLVVRNTDINIFLPKLIWYRFLVKLSVSRAKCLVFVSYAHRRRFEKLYPAIYNKASRVEVVPNGVDKFWLDNMTNVDNGFCENNVIFVGGFDKNKNLKATYLALDLARKTNPSLNLLLIGGNEIQVQQLIELSELPSWVKVVPFVLKEDLIDYYRCSSIFLMPSFHETFGLVYVEALSQGCSLIFTENEGIDGCFDGFDFAIPVDPSDIRSIANAILSLNSRLPKGVPFETRSQVLNRFAWSEVSRQYLNIIESKLNAHVA